MKKKNGLYNRLFEAAIWKNSTGSGQVNCKHKSEQFPYTSKVADSNLNFWKNYQIYKFKSATSEYIKKYFWVCANNVVEMFFFYCS